MFCSSCGAAMKEGSTFCGTCGRPVESSAAQAPAAAVPGAVVPATSTPPIIQGGMMAARDTGLYAGFWLRVVASIIDGLIIGIPFRFYGYRDLCERHSTHSGTRHDAKSQSIPVHQPFLPAIVAASRFGLARHLVVLEPSRKLFVASDAWQKSAGPVCDRFVGSTG